MDKKVLELTNQEREVYARDGFFIRPNAFETNEIDVLRDKVEDLVTCIETANVLTTEQKKTILKRNTKATATSGAASLGSIWRLHLFSAAVRAHIRDPRRLDVVTDLVGPDLFCPNDLYFFKPPGTGQPIAWHQDSWYFKNTFVSSVGETIDTASIGTWLALDDADEENGCLWVVPGSHHMGVVDHTHVKKEAFFLQKEVVVTGEQEQQAIPVEVPKGALVFFNNALLHRSTVNRSDRFRRAYIVHYMKASIQYIPGMMRVFEGAEHWGTTEMYVCGKQVSGCVQTTPEEKSMDWDRAVGRSLTEEDIRISD